MPEPTLDILGTHIAPGEIRRLLWIAGETTYGSKLETPVYVIRGTRPGPALCLTAAVHGDELNGVEIIRKLVSDISPKKLNGTVIGVPIVNLLGFTRGTRYLPDRRDLNRYFPGNPEGSSASRIAFSFFEDIVRHCDMLIDLHTGSLTRTNMPQVRANLQIPEVLDFTTKFGSTAVLHSTKLRGNLRSAATNYGIPAVALELGEPGSLQMEHVDEGVEIIETVLSGLGMTRQLWKGGESQPVFYSSRWVRVNTGGLLISSVEVGERIQQGAVLGSMVNPITNESFDVVSPYSGRVLGMALNQFMLPGYAAFNIGIVADKAEVVDDARIFGCINAEPEPDLMPEELECVPEDYEEFREAIERQDINRGTSEGEEGS
jgi:predicted deacylase